MTGSGMHVLQNMLQNGTTTKQEKYTIFITRQTSEQTQLHVASDYKITFDCKIVICPLHQTQRPVILTKHRGSYYSCFTYKTKYNKTISKLAHNLVVICKQDFNPLIVVFVVSGMQLKIA